MIMRILGFTAIVFITHSAVAQKSKVQTAWRALSDYEETLKEGKPNISYLNKAKEAIDLALANDDTKNQSKAHAYNLRISYALFQYNLDEERKKLEPTVSDKNERLMVAYGNTPLNDFEAASEELNKIKDLDPKFLETIQAGLEKGVSSLDEDELKFALAAQQLKMEAGNIAAGKYKAKKYDEAADYFYKTGVMNTILYKTKDTANFYNACVSASKAKNTDKILEYNKKMIEVKIASPFNYEAFYTAQLSKGDSSSAMESLRKGRASFPDDIGLLTQETNLFLARGKQQEALNNLKVSIQKDPKNALFYFITGQIYENMANPKDKASGKDLEKPANFEELFKNAESNYLKSIELNPSNKEYLYNALYNLGAMYNNYGGYIANRKIEKITDMAKYQKENEAKAQEYYKKAIPYLERALDIKSDDRSTMSALRKLYLLTGNDAKALEMSNKLK
jgi:tetratricopeptide (TPR) repeat protein